MAGPSSELEFRDRLLKRAVPALLRVDRGQRAVFVDRDAASYKDAIRLHLPSNMQQEHQRHRTRTFTEAAVLQRQTNQPQLLLAEQRRLVSGTRLYDNAAVRLLHAYSSGCGCHAAG